MATSQSSIVVQMTSDEARLLEGMRKIIEKEQQMGDGLSKADREAAKLEKSMQKAADRIKELNLTPLERYQREVAKADQLLQKGKLTQEQFNREVARQGTIMASRTTQEESFAGALGRTAGQILTVENAVRGVETAFNAVAAARDNALGGYRDLEESNRKLLQISKKSSGGPSAKQMEERADDAASLFGIDRATARDVLFSSYSEGFDKYYEKVLSARSTIDPAQAASVAGQVPGMFHGQVNPWEALNLGLSAAEFSRLDFTGLGRSIPIVSEGGAQQGSTPQESFALLSVLAAEYKSGETAGERIKLLASKMANDAEYQGIGIMAAYDKLAALPEEDRRAFLGDSTELNSAFSAITRNRALIGERTAQMDQTLVDTKAGRGPLDLRIAESRESPLVVANERAINAKNAMEIRREKVAAVGAAEAERQRNQAIEYAYARGGETVGGLVDSGLSKGANQTAFDSGYGLGGWISRNRQTAAAIAFPFFGPTAATIAGFTGGEKAAPTAEVQMEKVAANLNQAAENLNSVSKKFAQNRATWGKDQ